MLTALIQLAIGFAILSFGGHAIVSGAVSVALLARVSTAVVGLTVVAFATSLPEMAVSVQAAATGATDIAYANVIGSSIFNIAAILALTALIRPVVIRPEARRFEYPIMFAVLSLCLLLARDRLISRTEGVTLIVVLVAFLAVTALRTRKQRASAPVLKPGSTTHPNLATRWARGVGLIALGIIGLTWGANFMVRGAVTIAELWGISERIIGLTVIAVGTSLPELVTSGIAALRGEDEIALSNILGSNIFNILAVLGTTSALFPVPVHARAAALDNWVMLACGAALLPIVATSSKVNRAHGIVLLVGFAVYMGVLVTMG